MEFRTRITPLRSLLLLMFLHFSLQAITVRSTRVLLATSTEISDCLRPGKAKVVLPGSADYNAARGHVFNQRFLYSPAAIVFATTTAHVQNAVTCAIKLKIGIAPRCGGHSYEDYSLGGRDGVLVVDLGGLNEVRYNNITKRATVGAGSRLGPMKLALWNQGKVSIPSGTCPSVGVAGHVLGGGWGFLSRKWGVMCDSLVEAKLVNRNGVLVTVSATRNPDLFFALRGAGANSFGIVTQFTFNTFDVSKKVTSFSFSFDKSQQAQTVRAFQSWGLTAPADVSASLYQDPSGGNTFFGLFLGPQAQLSTLLSKFLTKVPAPKSSVQSQVDYITSVLTDGGFKATDPPSILDLKNFNYPTATFKSKSIFSKSSGFPEAGIQAYIQALQAGPTSSYFIFDLFGGSGSAINRVRPGTTAFVHRNSLFSIQMFSYWQGRPAAEANGTAFMKHIWSAVRPFSSSEAYQNYIDSEMPLSAYYGSNLPRLEALKSKWDPQNVFNFPQSIPLP